MEGLVLDASITMTWCYPDEHSGFAYRVLDELENRQAIVPSLWAIEVENAVVVGERRRRLTISDIARFFELLQGLSIETDIQTASRALGDTLQLARTHGLSTYVAAYLELAMREGLMLATLDSRVKKSGRSGRSEGICLRTGRLDHHFFRGPSPLRMDARPRAKHTRSESQLHRDCATNSGFVFSHHKFSAKFSCLSNQLRKYGC